MSLQIHVDSVKMVYSTIISLEKKEKKKKEAKEIKWTRGSRREIVHSILQTLPDTLKYKENLACTNTVNRLFSRSHPLNLYYYSAYSFNIVYRTVTHRHKLKIELSPWWHMVGVISKWKVLPCIHQIKHAVFNLYHSHIAISDFINIINIHISI